MTGARRSLDAATERALRVVTRAARSDAIARLPGGCPPAQPPPVLPRSWVYFIRSGTAGPIKIGYARDPYARLMNLRTSSPDEVRYLGHLPGGLDEERAVHERFAHLRIRGEWFEPAPELLAFIAEHRFDADA